jgi:hypothetical protein
LFSVLFYYDVRLCLFMAVGGGGGGGGVRLEVEGDRKWLIKNETAPLQTCCA